MTFVLAFVRLDYCRNRGSVWPLVTSHLAKCEINAPHLNVGWGWMGPAGHDFDGSHGCVTTPSDVSDAAVVDSAVRAKQQGSPHASSTTVGGWTW